MAYEIPKNLRYEEKIVFGLTFWQFFWLALFGGLAAIVFFKTNLDLLAKACLSVFFMLLGVGFAFLNFGRHLSAYRAYWSSVGEAGFLDKRLRQFVEAQKIENDAIFLRNGSLRAVLEVTPINFSILSEEEKRAVVSAYRDFLNSLDFPVQVVMRTTALNLDDYLFDLRKSVFALNNRELEQQFDSFKEFVQKFILQSNVKNRLFYVVVPYSPFAGTNAFSDLLAMVKNFFSKRKSKTGFDLNRETALNQLNVRVELCAEKLKRCELHSKRLNDKQLLSLLASFFDSFIEAENDYFFPLTLLEKFNEKGGNAVDAIEWENKESTAADSKRIAAAE